MTNNDDITASIKRLEDVAKQASKPGFAHDVETVCREARQAAQYREYLQRAKNAISTRSNDDNGCRYAFNLMQEALKND